MDKWSSELLEFESLRAILARYVGSSMGEAKLALVEPLTDRGEIESLLGDTAEAIAFLQAARSSKAGAPSRVRFSGLPDVRDSAGKLRIEGAVLDGEELYGIASVLGRVADAKKALGAYGGRLAAIVQDIPDLSPHIRAIERAILPDGTVSDDASPELARLRRDRTRQQRAIHESLEKFVRANRDNGVLQEDYVTKRNDRFVVPVAAGQRRRVDGVIHGASGTGQTLFIEPLETIALNNDLVRVSEEEAREVHRILRELSHSLHLAGPAVPEAVAVFGDLDLLFAKAEYALSFDATIPKLSGETDRMLRLRGARHPLLADVLRTQKKAIVPVTVELSEQARTLLITGPNTGGKTVAMKTVGLFILMAQSGIPVPCESAELPVFEQVLADIGDNQSIAESLSSFSSHVTRIAQICESVTRDSLVLLDELGRATDPEEGGALGVAVIDQLRQTGTFCVASTHLMALKVYGANTPGVVNGSMGFDEETLTPTFALRTGAPGRSAGLAIASRLGLPPALIDRARAAMSSNARDIAEFLSELHSKLEAASQREEELSKKLAAVNQREQELESAFAKQREQGRRELEQKTADVLESLEKRSRQAIEEIRAAAASRKAADQAQIAASRALREMKETVQSAVGARSSTFVQEKLSEGARVKLAGIREAARVKRILGNGKIEVEAGFMKMQVRESDVLEVLPPADGPKLPKGVSFTSGPSWTLSEREVNIIGKTAEEAGDELDRFLDKAAMASVDRVRIIHGHGMGVLKREVAARLSASPHVERFEQASQAEGGSGATIAFLRG